MKQIGLIDGDKTKYPNIALMKLSSFWKSRSANVEWALAWGSKINVIEETILNRYCKNYTITFATSNYPIDEKYLKYSERVISRMREMFAYYELTGEDRR